MPYLRSTNEQLDPAFEPVLEILWHADLRRVGEQSAPESLETPVEFGRMWPPFQRDGLAPGRGLDDPFVTRSAARIAWDAEKWLFHVETLAKEVRLYAPDGSPRERVASVEPGATLELSGRALVRLQLRRPSALRGPALGVIGESEAAWRLRDAVSDLARSDGPVLILGPPGSAKPAVARSLHAASGRKLGAFLEVRCEELPGTMLDSELFGHRAGAFEGAQDKLGALEAAAGGTVLVHHPSNLPALTRTRLEEAMREGCFTPRGARDPVSFDVRLLAAVTGPLAPDFARFEAGFADRVEVPALAERREDIPHLLARMILGHAKEPSWAHLAHDADYEEPMVPLALCKAAMSHDWRRNVAELEHLVGAILHRSKKGRRASWPAWVGASAEATLPPSVIAPGPVTDEIDDATVAAAMEATGFDPERTAVSLGMPVPAILRSMDRLELPRAETLSLEEIEEAKKIVGDDPAALARFLKVSRRGLADRRDTLK